MGSVVMADKKPRFVARYLDPSARMSELLFGLIMTLTFTLGASLVIEEGPDAVKELLIGVIGCNIAWGVIDGILYVMTSMMERGKVHRAARTLRLKGDAAATSLIREELAEEYGAVLTDDTQNRVVGELLAELHRAEPGRVKVTKEDVGGAIASFWLVFATAIPAVVPFLMIDKLMLALRVSNFLLVALMFCVAWVWAKYTHANPWLTGLGMTVFGLILVQATIMLGG